MCTVQSLILFPVFAQVVLTFAVLSLLGIRRSAFLRRTGKTNQDMALATDSCWNERCTQARRNFQSQFELPVLFYVVCLFALVLRQVDVLLLILAILFVASRIGHTVVHVTSNIVARRAAFWFFGLFAVVGMWVVLIVRVAAVEL
jgi:hypothetical protein